MSKQRNYYTVLGVSSDADTQAIKDAYRRLAKESHPDAHGRSEAERFREATEAYTTLRDPSARRQYDESMRAAETPRGYDLRWRDPAGFDRGSSSDLSWDFPRHKTRGPVRGRRFGNDVDDILSALRRRGLGGIFSFRHNRPFFDAESKAEFFSTHEATEFELTISVTPEEAAAGGSYHVQIPNEPGYFADLTIPRGVRDGTVLLATVLGAEIGTIARVTITVD